MPALHTHRSNRVEILARELGELLSEPLDDPLQPELIVVQSLGMRRWLSFQIASHLGVAMNCDFPFFVEFAQRLFRSAFSGVTTDRAFNRDVLPWRILRALPEVIEEPAFAPLRRYIGSDAASEVKEFQLARQIAAVFDQYMAFSPKMLLEWEAQMIPRLREQMTNGELVQGGGGGWQAELWRRLAAHSPGEHPPALLERLGRRIEQGDVSLPGFPARICVFGVASLPQFYIDLLALAACCLDVHLFLFEPTDQYWGDIQSPAEQRRFLRRHAREGQTAADYHLDLGNELLASLGAAGRDFTRQVQELEPAFFSESFAPPEPRTLLTRVQSDIFALRSARQESGGEELKDPRDLKDEDLWPPLDPGDSTIQIHCCHGPMRELEVLHDQLLDLFDRVPGLTPKDILVMLPNVETHAPFIDAVFGSPEKEGMRIPFTIADRSAQAQSIVARTLLRLLDLHGSRFGAGAVLEILEARPVRERFGIAETDLDTIRGWIERTNIRWGIDAPHRMTFDLPGFEQNSWRAGLDRCLLGYALLGDGEALYEGVLPDTEIEGNLAELLGRFADLTESLFQFIPRLGVARTLTEWSETLRRLFEAFFSDAGEDSGEIFRGRRVVGEIAELAEYYAGKVTFAAMRAHLEAVLSDAESASGFLAGHVTFCSLKPMRSIPFRVVCLLGMNDTAFPRRETPLAFDLLAEQARASGRSRRDEDRQLFLEAILSARDVLYLSYAGLSAKENSEAPPAVVVTELLDYLETAYGFEVGREKLREMVLRRHPLQPFSTRYFTPGGGLFSYSAENGRASEAGWRPRLTAAPLMDGPLPEPEAEWRTVDLRALTDFFCHPARYFLEKRLRVRLPEHEEALDESEPMTLDHLARWQLSQSFAQSLLAGGDAARRIQTARAAGLLPAGHFGEVEIARVVADMTELVDRVRAAPLGAALPPLLLSLRIGEWHLHGTVDRLYEGGLLHTTGWKITPKDRLRAWIAHLFLNAGTAKGASGGRETYLFGTDGCWHGLAAPEAASLLGDLLDLYGRGLRAPLPFFPKSSYELVRRKLRPRKNESIYIADSARDAFEEGEMADLHNDLCVRHAPSPYGPEWEELACAVFEPMFNHAEEPAS